LLFGAGGDANHLHTEERFKKWNGSVIYNLAIYSFNSCSCKIDFIHP